MGWGWGGGGPALESYPGVGRCGRQARCQLSYSASHTFSAAAGPHKIPVPDISYRMCSVVHPDPELLAISDPNPE
jgi:hypothetical protein